MHRQEQELPPGRGEPEVEERGRRPPADAHRPPRGEAVESDPLGVATEEPWLRRRLSVEMGAVPLRGRPHHRQYVGEELRRMWIANPVAVGVMLAMKDRVG